MTNPIHWKIFARFRSGDRFLWWKFLGASAHLLAILSVLLFSSIYYPNSENKPKALESKAQLEEKIRLHQLLLEALDSIVRYQHYYREVYGFYSRNIMNLGLPEIFASGTLSEIEQHYEISVLESTPRKFLILAVTNPSMGISLSLRNNRITIDENYRIQANFPLPTINKKFLNQEAERILQLKIRSKPSEVGIAKDFWKLEERFDGDRSRWIATGLKGEVTGSQRYLTFGEDSGRNLASIFSQVKRQLNLKVGSTPTQNPATSINKRKNNHSPDPQEEGYSMNVSNLYHFLQEARLAQHIYFREHGSYAEEWENLDEVTSFHFVDRSLATSNIQLEPLERTEEGFAIRVKGTQGDILGEVFSMSENGEMKQIRYSDVLVEELRESNEYLQNSFLFQISEVPKSNTVTGEKVIRRPKQRTFLTD